VSKFLLLLLVMAPCLAMPGTNRDKHQRAAFVRSHPCPDTGKTHGRCPGYVVDHIVPLCGGGADRPSNMQWQTVAEGKAKDKEERRFCGQRRR
jgi:hypothetical protein